MTLARETSGRSSGLLERVAGVLIAAFALTFIAVVVLRPVDEGGLVVFSDLALSGSTFIAGLSTILLAWSLQGRERVSWLLMGAGTLSWSLGIIAWSWYELVLHEETPFPSLADLGYLGMIPLMFAGLVTLPAGRVPVEGRLKIALDALIVLAGLVTLAWLTLLGPLYADAESTVLERVISLAYPFGDLLLLAALVGGAARGWIGLRNPSLPPLVIGILTFAFADLSFAFLTLHDAYVSGNPIDVGWPLGHLLVTFAIIRRVAAGATSEGGGGSTRTSRPRWFSVVRLTAPYVSVVGATGLVFGRFAWHGTSEQNVLLLLALGTILAAMVRQFLTVRENDRLNGELRRFSAGLEAIVEDRTARLSLLHDLASRLGRASTRSAADNLLARAADMVVRQMQVDRVVLLETTAEGSLATLAAEARDGFEGTLAGVQHRELALRAIEAGKPVVMTIASSDGVTSRGIALGVPLPGAGSAMGAITVTTADRTDYLEEDVHFVESVANLVGLTLERVRAADQLRREHAHNVQLLRTVPSVLIGTDAAGRIHLWNRAAEEHLGLASADMLGRRLLECELPCDVGDIELRLGRASQVGTSINDDLQYWRKDGTPGYLSLTVTRMADENGTPAGHLVIGKDITDRRELEEQLRHQALHDPLTRLANRALFRDRLDHALRRWRVEDGELAVLFVDLDDFKGVNDSLGHPTGDQVLHAVGERIAACLHAADTLARLGGDEFAVLIEGAEARNAARLAEAVLRALSAPFDLDDRSLHVAASIGIAAPLTEEDSADDLLRNADIAMYAAKARGKGRFVVFDASLHSEVLERVQLEADLRQAIEHGEMYLEYQPIVSLATGEAAGSEALVRWHHPERGIVSPAWFVPAAERSGVITTIDRWVMDRASAQVHEWRERMPGVPLRVSVNLSATELDQPDLVEDVRGLLERYQLDPTALVIEITEGALAADVEVATERLNALRELGIRIAIDDFGTGYSSLSSLRRFPVDILKIDKSFVDQMEHDAEGEAMVSAIVELARVLNLETVAEGVETWSQAQRLRRLGCGYGQGYYFARPLQAEQAWEVLQASHSARAAS